MFSEDLKKIYSVSVINYVQLTCTYTTKSCHVEPNISKLVAGGGRSVTSFPAPAGCPMLTRVKRKVTFSGRGSLQTLSRKANNKQMTCFWTTSRGSQYLSTTKRGGKGYSFGLD